MGFFDFFKKKILDDNGSNETAKSSMEPAAEPEKAAEDAFGADQTDGLKEAVQEEDSQEDARQEDTAEKEGQMSGLEEDLQGAVREEDTAAMAERMSSLEEELQGVVREEEAESMNEPEPWQTAEKQPLSSEEMAKREELIRKRDEEGKVLAYLIQHHHDVKTVESLQAALKSFMTCWLWVPMCPQFSELDTKAMQTAMAEGRKVEPKDPVKFVPSHLTLNDGQLVYPAFSNRDEIPKAISQKFVWQQMSAAQYAYAVVRNRAISAMIINPHSKNLRLKRELLEKLVKPVQ